MTVRALRDFLNSLDLESIQEDISVNSVTMYEGEKFISVDELASADIYEASSEEFKPYLVLTIREADELLEEYSRDSEV